MKRVMAGLLIVLLASPFEAWAAKMFAVTPSGAAETVFAANASKVVAELSGKCMDSHWTVVSSNDHEVVCEAPLSAGQSIFSQLLIGNSYSTPPRRFFRFNVAENSGVSRVQASGWIETQMAFGQVNRVELTGPDFHNGMMAFMGSAGGKLPAGTTFPNHVIMGFNAENVQQGKYGALLVKEVLPATPAEKAGLQSGDTVIRIAGRRFKNDEEYLGALERAAKNPTYPVEVSREGKLLTFVLERQFRPAITENVVVEEKAGKSQETSSPSVADELIKLSELKDKGLLTDEEFKSAKARLLSE